MKITKELIKESLENGKMKLIADPNDVGGTVCSIPAIGSMGWFYFSEEADRFYPGDYAVFYGETSEKTVNDIYNALLGIMQSDLDEYTQYETALLGTRSLIADAEAEILHSDTVASETIRVMMQNEVYAPFTDAEWKALLEWSGDSEYVTLEELKE